MRLNKLSANGVPREMTNINDQPPITNDQNSSGSCRLPPCTRQISRRLPWSFPCAFRRAAGRDRTGSFLRFGSGRLIQPIFNGRPGIVDDLLGGAADQPLRHSLEQSAEALDLRDPLHPRAAFLRRHIDRGLDSLDVPIPLLDRTRRINDGETASVTRNVTSSVPRMKA